MKWYKEKTYQMAIATMAFIGIVMVIGTSIVDKRFVYEAFYLFGAGIIITTIGQIISYRK